MGGGWCFGSWFVVVAVDVDIAAAGGIIPLPLLLPFFVIVLVIHSDLDDDDLAKEEGRMSLALLSQYANNDCLNPHKTQTNTSV